MTLLDKKRNESYGYLVFKVFNFLFMLAVAAVTLLPYINVLAKALNDGQDAARGGIYLLPRKFTVDNFKTLLSDSEIYHAAGVSVARVVVVTVLALTVQTMTAYALSRKHLMGLKFINVYFMIPMFISGGLIPQYLLYSKMGLLDNFWVYILPCLFSFYNVMIIRSYISGSIPDAIIEAAEIDGITELGLWFKIILPLSKPVLATIALWLLVGAWNDWSMTLYFIDSPSLHTLQYKLMQAIKETERMTALIQEAIQNGKDVEGILASQTASVTTDSLTNAQIIVVTLPIICVYPFLQKYFTAGVTLGAVKG